MTIECASYRGLGRQPWRWRLVARNGRTVADGSEGYATRRGLTLAVGRLRRAGRAGMPVVWA